jgi:alginate O-acetyltransferase complex protein AlgI
VIATVAFGAQIYGDFSGYTDIARGSSRLLGIELPLNFRSPYVADSVSDFWHRWHITLSSWLRDYLYIPLGGNRARPARVYANLFITMALGGLWHGASVTFILWGAYHGLLLIAERARGGGARTGVRRLVGVVGTFVGVQVGWALFRAHDFATLAALGGRLVADPLGREPLIHAATYLPLVVGFYGAHALSAALRERPWIHAALLRPVAASVMLAAAAVVVVVFGGSSDAFIYFQF